MYFIIWDKKRNKKGRPWIWSQWVCVKKIEQFRGRRLRSFWEGQRSRSLRPGLWIVHHPSSKEYACCVAAVLVQFLVLERGIEPRTPQKVICKTHPPQWNEYLCLSIVYDMTSQISQIAAITYLPNDHNCNWSVFRHTITLVLII